MGVDSEISIIKSCKEEKQIFQRWKLLLMNKIRSCKYGKDGVQRDKKKKALIPTGIWKQLKVTADQRTGKLEHRRLWLYMNFLIHINTSIFKRLFCWFVYFCIAIFWNKQYKQFLSNLLHFYREFSRKSLTMFNLICFLSTH